MRVLAITKVFPNRVVPLDAPHMSQRYASLSERCHMTVLATIPWYPGATLFSRWSYAGKVAAAPRREIIRGLEVYHPRFLFVPKAARMMQWMLYASSILPDVIARRREIDVIWATWVYPDGIAAIWLGEQLGLPVVVEAIGSDVHILAHWSTLAPLLRRFLPRATRMIAVSRPLAEELTQLGAAPDRIDVIPTGINSELFAPRDRTAARQRLSRAAGERLILYVGRLEDAKGVFDLLDAFQRVAASDPAATLVYVGGGDCETVLRERAASLGRRVLLAGQRPLSEVAEWLAACDVLALPSWSEGTPNVILEALGAGRRVVASRVGGIPDVVTSPLLGELTCVRDVSALAAALGRAISTPYDPIEVSRCSGVLGLDEVAARIESSLELACQAHTGNAGPLGRLLRHLD